jgi:hypothetical protein
MKTGPESLRTAKNESGRGKQENEALPPGTVENESESA